MFELSVYFIWSPCMLIWSDDDDDADGVDADADFDFISKTNTISINENWYLGCTSCFCCDPPLRGHHP